MKYFNNDIYSNPGSPFKTIYSPVVNDDGTIDLVESGKENTDEYIQSQLESTDITTIITRFTAGDDSAFYANNGVYGDFTEMPKSFAEMLQLQIDSKRLYDSLPIDIKNMFDNDSDKFFALSGTEEWYEKLGYKKVKENVESEVKDKEE